jgi:hypothetical protein
MESYEPASTTTEESGQVVQLCSDFLTWREVGDELVVFNAERGTYLTLNASAKELWQDLANGTTVAELVHSLCARFDLSVEQASDDVESFLFSLSQRELLVKVPQ